MQKREPAEGAVGVNRPFVAHGGGMLGAVEIRTKPGCVNQAYVELL
jgi:hypothetical protein